MGDLQSCFDYDRNGILLREAQVLGTVRKVRAERSFHLLLHLAGSRVLRDYPGLLETQLLRGEGKESSS